MSFAKPPRPNPRKLEPDDTDNEQDLRDVIARVDDWRRRGSEAEAEAAEAAEAGDAAPTPTPTPNSLPRPAPIAPLTPIRAPFLDGRLLKVGTPNITFTSKSSMTMPSSSPSYSSPPTIPQKRNHDAYAFHLGAMPATPGTMPVNSPTPLKRQATGDDLPVPVPSSFSAQVPPPPATPGIQGQEGMGETNANANTGVVVPFRDSRVLAMEKRIRALNEENFELWRANDRLKKELLDERTLHLGNGNAPN